MTNLIIITGTSRSGKTELTKKLLNLPNSTVISTDALINGLLMTDEFSKYNKKNKSKDKNYLYLEPILIKIIHITSFTASTIILDSELLVPLNYDRFKTLFDPTEFKFDYYCLGQTRISAEDKLKLYETNPELLGWMNVYSEQELTEVVTHHFELNQKVKTSCKTFGYEFYDTSFEFDKVINRIKRIIKNKIKLSNLK
jgi:hypothetical protein